MGKRKKMRNDFAFKAIISTVMALAIIAIIAQNPQAGQWIQDWIVLTSDTEQPLTLSGDATTWEDMHFDIARAILGPSNSPSLVADAPGLALSFSDQGNPANEEEISFRPQMNHRWREGSTIYPHIHFNTSDANTGVIRIGFHHSWTNTDGTWPAASTVYTNITIAAGSNVKHLTASFPAIDGSGKTISSMIKCRFFRNSSNAADTYTGNLILQELDIHYEVDSLGSRTELVK